MTYVAHTALDDDRLGHFKQMTNARSWLGLWELCSKFLSLFYSEFLLKIHHYARFYSFYASDCINIPNYN